eukprot:TRINITY_DN39390_c0_g1_i1.p1 TRINITY_DN39390_c0_g1~~TRINITY_DN39390_c0_g1_i1.p1  ORF type:complete len:404 (+),score=83.31 TRINITY_DN39390_c0_g1_i1:65-1276(+)
MRPSAVTVVRRRVGRLRTSGEGRSPLRLRAGSRSAFPLTFTAVRAPGDDQQICWSSPRVGSRRFGSCARAHPVVDVGGLLPQAGCGERRRAALKQVSDALLGDGLGYFYVANVSEVLPAEYIKSIYGFARTAHKLPLEVKRRFVGNGGSSKAGSSYSGEDAGELELAYEPGTKASARAWDFSRLRGSPGMEPVYPEMSPGFRETLDELYDRQNVIGQALLVAFAEVLGQPADIFARHFASGDMGTIRLIHYPGDEEAPADADVGIAPHTDFEAFTLMHQDAPGLQFLPPNEHAWIDAPVRDAEFVVILGDVLERFTNGVLRATPHRVVRKREPRQSIIRFNAVAPDTVIEPLPDFVTSERPRAYTRCTMRQHMETTIRNLEQGLGSWDKEAGVSRSAHYRYEE